MEMDNEELTELFKRIEKQVITILTNTKYGTPLKLKKDIDITVRSAVRTAYDSAKGLIDTAVIGSNAVPTRILLPGIIAASTKDVKSVARWELAGHYSGIADNVQRQINDTINELNKTGSATVVQVQSALIKKFEEDGVLNVEYKGGRSVKASKYAEMVSRTARVECENLRGIATAEKIGTDIVEIIGNDNTCSVCAKYRDRWYSISGKSTEYPALYETALSKGYNVIHPNCRCTVNPISLKFYNDEEIAAMKVKSNAPFEDDRSARQKAEYDKWQFNNRRDWQELQDFQEMKAQLGDKAPYKTLGGYRRAVRQEEKPLNLKKLIYHDKDVKQLEEFKTVLVDNMPYDLDKFQEMKYTNVDKYEELKKRKDNAYLGMNFDQVKEKIGLLSNTKARTWYYNNVHELKSYIDSNLSFEEKARAACNMRNAFKEETRMLMCNEEDRMALDRDFPVVDFETRVMDKMIRKGLSREDAIVDVYNTSDKTNLKVDKKYLEDK